MEIINHYKPGQRVKRYSQIANDAEEMSKFLEAGIAKGNYERGFALAHNQVEEVMPFTFFVNDLKYVGKDKLWEAREIINPEILETPKEIGKGNDKKKNLTEYDEGCFSFPFRKTKRVKRFFRIKVRYYIKGRFFWLKKIERWIEGLPAHIFQHEEQHCRGMNIYFDK